MGPVQFSYQDFIKIYLESRNAEEAGLKLGVSKFTVERHARILRKKGVKLPTFGRTPTIKEDNVDVEALNKLIEETRGA